MEGLRSVSGAVVYISDRFCSFYSTIWWHCRNCDSIATMILPVIFTGFAIHRSCAIFICQLYIAGHVQILSINGKRKECRPDYREKKYTSAHNNSLKEKDKKNGIVTKLLFDDRQ